MRDFLDAILSFIGAESLTDDEYEGIDLDSQSYNQATYDALSAVLVARESVSTVQERLISYFEARGVSVTPADTANSNVFLGDVLN